MYNTYISSTLALRTKTSLCYSVNDYYLVNQTRFQNNSFSSSPCSSCCSCCAFPMYGGVPPINPRFLYGLRQSTLIQCSASKKLILGRGESGYCRLPVCNSDSICYGDSYSVNVKESSRNKEKDFGKRGRKFSCMVWEEECENFDTGIDENTEAMLSLLTEDIGEKLVDVGRRINRSRNSEIRVERRSRGVSEGIKEEKKYVDSGSSRKNSSCKCQSVTIKSREEGNRQSKGTLDSSRGENRRARKGEFSQSSYYSGGIVVGRRGRDGNECIKEEEKRVESCSLGRNSSWEIESTKNKSREEGSRWSCETEVPSRGESVGFRKEGSSCSSYYSNLSSDIIDESNVHNQVEHERYGDESTSNWRSEESRRDEKERFARDVKKQSKKYEDGVRQYGEVSEKVSNEVHGSKIIGIDDISRNETEKLVETRGTERVYGSQTKLSNRNNNTTSSASIVQETRKQHYEKGYQGIQISEESRREPEHHTETSNAHESYNKRVSNSRKNFSEREEQQVAAANLVLQARERNRRIGQQTEVVNVQENYTNITSNSEKRYGVKEEKLSSEANIVLEERERNSQINQQTYFSETQKSYNDRASTSEKRLSEREERLTTAVNLVLEAVTNIQKIYNDTTTNSQMKFSEREEKLLAAASLVLETRERNNQVDQQIQRTDIQKSYDVEASTSQERFSEREEQQSAAIDLVLEAREKNSRIDQRTETSVIQETYNESRSTYQKQLTEREERLTTAANLVLGARERSNRMDQITEQNESTRVSQQLSRVSDIKNADMQRASNSQRLSETRMKNVEESSTSIRSSFEEAKEQNIQANQGVVDIRRSRKESQDLINMSVTSALNTEVLNTSQKRTETKMSTQEETSSLHVDFPQGVGEKHNETSGQIIRQVQSTREPQRPSGPSLSLSESSTESRSSTQRPVPLVHLVREQTFGSKKAQERIADMRDSQAMVTPPPSQLVIRSSPENFNQEPSDRNEIQQPSAETSESSSTALYLHPQGETPSPDDAVMSNESYTEDSNVILNEDALVSANRLEESSTMLVDEFMEKLRNEVSTSKVLEKTTSSRSHEVFEDVQSQMHGSRRSSSLSGRGGPSDEMWDVAGPSQEPSRTEAHAEVTPTDQDTTVKRTSRSLWNIVSDIVRIRWGTHSETHTPTLKSGGRTSSNESVGTEIWFSGNEADMTDDAKVKKGKRRRPKRSKSADPPNLRKGYKVMGFPESITQREGHTSSSADTVERSSASKRASSTSKEESSGHEADEKRSQNSPPSVVSTNPSLLKRRLIRSPPVQDEPLDSNIEISGSGSKDMEDNPYTERPSELIETKVKDMELKQRKFERNKQLAKERFEEWEEAFLFENEQRKTDEMFMREALLEAKKAGDTWEVPVGAVLVQHGKIIARGYNLVEALRDSTAHAEMICIREASNVLRTWRLADTTLYVTLEPCPMCAGAILQARVDTVVWGAPNKLLGADGSWVRLFPGGGEGESSSDMTNQAAGPVHPFHPKMTIRRGILGTECADIMQRFFQLRRKKKERRSESPPPPPSCLRISAHPSKILSKMHDVFHIMFCL